jgi:hypothetical protein
MKAEQKIILGAIDALDPAAVSAVTLLKLLLVDGRIFPTKSVTTDKEMLWASHAMDENHWIYIPRDHVVGLEVMVDPKLLNKDAGATLPEWIKFYGSR